MAILQSRPTIRDIGRKTGFHYSTVSLALRDHPRIPDATKQIIRDAAKGLGYQPDAMLSALCSLSVDETAAERTDCHRLDNQSSDTNRLEVGLYARLF